MIITHTFIAALIITFAALGVGAFAYMLLPKERKHFSILIGIISIFPIFFGMFYIVFFK